MQVLLGLLLLFCIFFGLPICAIICACTSPIAKAADLIDDAHERRFYGQQNDHHEPPAF